MRIIISKKCKDNLPGGLADKHEPKEYDKDQLEKGTKVEKEHTNDTEVAEEIAMDHLEESDDKKGKKGEKYYDKLKRMEERKKESKTLFNLMKLAKFAKKKKKDKEKNEYAICTESIGKTEGTTERSKWSADAKARYDRCLKHVDPKEHGKAPND